MFQSLQDLIEEKLKKRGLALSRSDIIDWVQESLPEGADDTLGRALRTLTSQFWGSLFRVTRLDPHQAECEVWATPKKLRTHVHCGVVLGAATEIVVMVWQRHLLLDQVEISVTGVEANWSHFENGTFVRYELDPAQVQEVMDHLRESDTTEMECPIRVFDRSSCLIGEILVKCQFTGQLPQQVVPPQSEDSSSPEVEEATETKQ